MPSDTASSVRELIGKSCLLLDEEKFDQWLELCEPAFRYEIKTFSAELRKEMTWLNLDHAGLKKLFQTLRTHERDLCTLTRHPSTLLVRVSEDGRSAETITSLMVTRTSAIGESQLFVAGRYYDAVSLEQTEPLLKSRRVQLATRVLMSDAGGSHVPI